MSTETLNQAVRSTGNVNTDLLMRDVAPNLARLEPSANPLTRLLIDIEKSSRKVKNPKFESLELRRPSEWDAANGTVNATTTANTVTVDHGEYFMTGDVVLNADTGEVMHVTSVSGDVLTVTRAIGDEIATINDNHDILRIGNAQPENGSATEILTREVESVYNYIQILRKTWGHSNTALETDNYGEKDVTTRNKEAAMEHVLDIEKTLWFGKRHILASTTFPRRMAGGVFWYLDAAGAGSVISSSVGTLTLDAVDEWCEDLFRYDMSPKYVFSGPRALTAFNRIARDGADLPLAPEAEKFGIAIRTFVTTHGILKLVPCQLFHNDSYTGRATALTLKNLKLAYQGGQRTKLMRNIQNPDVDGVKHSLLSNVGLDLVLPETHGYMDGITG